MILIRLKRIRISKQVIQFCGSLVAVLILSSVALAQKHYMTSGSDAPGLTAQKKMMENPNLAGFVQPVQVFTPPGSLVSMWSSQGYGVPSDSVLTAGMAIGQVYRVRVESIPRFGGKEIYPSIEVIDRLNAPQGMENQFPIHVVITQDDLEKAISGRLVTKVIYLEDAKMSLPYRPVRDDQPYFDVGPSEDPLRTAEGLGRPMAILRIGSRTPSFEEFTTGGFDFYSGPANELPQPSPVNDDFFEPLLGKVGDLAPNIPEPNVPPIVPGNTYRSKRVRR